MELWDSCLQSSSAHNISFLRNWVKYIAGFYQGEFFGISDVNLFSTLRADFEYYFQCMSWFNWFSWFAKKSSFSGSFGAYAKKRILGPKHSNKKSEKYPSFTGTFHFRCVGTQFA